MKTIILIALIVAVAYSDDAEDCVRTKCKSLVDKCTKEALSCGLKAMNCQNKCNGDYQCNSNCATSSGNKTLIDLNQCGIDNCFAGNETVINYRSIFYGCDVLRCGKQFHRACMNGDNVAECALSFFEQNQSCSCLMELI